MKKSMLLAFLAMGLLAWTGLPSVHAYSPHYLPGGKNYLSADNFSYSLGILSTIDPFLVKPYTDYTLTIPRSYSENAEGSDVVVTYFTNDEEMDSVVYDACTDFAIVSGTNYFSITFQTDAQTNYLGLSLEDGRDPLSVGLVAQMQLEEGTQSTAATSIDLYIPGTMIDVNAPYFEGNPVVLSNVDDPITILEIQAGIQAYDAVDGDVTGSIEIITDGYTGNGGILGNYTILFRVEDEAMNVTDFPLTVKVVDVNSPLITGPGTVEVPHPLIKTTAELTALLSASDQHDGTVSGSLTIISDAYTANAGVIGEYEVVFEATDLSDNTSTYTMTVSVVDTAAPIFSGVSEVTIGYDQTLTVTEIRSTLGAIDGYDGDLFSAITLESDGYSSHLHEVGQYLLVFGVTDSSGNSAEKSVCVNVVDEIGPIIYFDTSIIRIYNSSVLTLTDFTTLLVKAHELSENTEYAVTIRFDSYTSHATIPGVYHLSLDFRSPEGEVLTKSFQIMVKVKPTGNIDGIPEDSQPTDTFFFQNQSWIIGSGFVLSLVLTNAVFLIIKRKIH